MDEYYRYILDGERFPVSKEIVFEIIHDLGGRKGLDNEWDDIDQEIQDEIIAAWVQKVEAKLSVQS